jgi:hypothetical protein
MGALGITTAEFDRYKRSFRQDSLRSAEQSKSMKHEVIILHYAGINSRTLHCDCLTCCHF